jgi:mono/diheme cytochrome c family protein
MMRPRVVVIPPIKRERSNPFQQRMHPMARNALRAGALSAFLTIFFGPVRHASAAGDARNGKVLAERWCTECHVVSSEQHRASEAAPTFAWVARRPGFNVFRLAFLLLDPHPKMPNMSLTRQEASDLAAYIAIQAKGP